MATDLRASASLVLAGLVAEGETIDRPHLPHRSRLREHRGKTVGPGREDPPRSAAERKKAPHRGAFLFGGDCASAHRLQTAGPSRPCRPCAAGCARAPAGRRRPTRRVCLSPSVRVTLVACCDLPPMVICFLARHLVVQVLGAAVVDHAVLQRLAGRDVARDRQVDQHRVEVAGLQLHRARAVGLHVAGPRGDALAPSRRSPASSPS